MKPIEKPDIDSMHSVRPFREWLLVMRALEADEPTEAAAGYQKIIRAYPFREEPYDRLMIVYRKTKALQKEVELIDKAIKTFNAHFGKPSVHHGKRKVAALSKSLQQAVGLHSATKDMYAQFQPIVRWQKRREAAMKKRH